jgi:hypothetical protein
MAFLLERRGEPYALLDLDYLSWTGPGGGRTDEFGLMLQNLAAVAANFRRAGIRLFVLAYFVRDAREVRRVRETLGMPLRVARLSVPLADIERRLTLRCSHLRGKFLCWCSSSTAPAGCTSAASPPTRPATGPCSRHVTWPNTRSTTPIFERHSSQTPGLRLRRLGPVAGWGTELMRGGRRSDGRDRGHSSLLLA